MGGNSTTWINTAILVTYIRNFRRNRGPVSGILKGYVGLSTAIFTDPQAELVLPAVQGTFNMLQAASSSSSPQSNACRFGFFFVDTDKTFNDRAYKITQTPPLHMVCTPGANGSPNQPHVDETRVYLPPPRAASPQPLHPASSPPPARMAAFAGSIGDAKMRLISWR
ncbi:hypothetical protein ACFXTI_039905 [Malus domestica]